jgi:hypothetical protein
VLDAPDLIARGRILAGRTGSRLTRPRIRTSCRPRGFRCRQYGLGDLRRRRGGRSRARRLARPDRLRASGRGSNGNPGTRLLRRCAGWLTAGCCLAWLDRLWRHRRRCGSSNLHRRGRRGGHFVCRLGGRRQSVLPAGAKQLARLGTPGSNQRARRGRRGCRGGWRPAGLQRCEDDHQVRAAHLSRAL